MDADDIGFGVPMKKFLVTGADGYIGRGVVERLLADGNLVFAMGRSPVGIQHVNLTELIGDIFCADLGFISKEAPDVLVHLAWRDGFSHYADSHIQDLPKHYGFIKNVIAAGIPQIAVMGSMHEVGYHEGVIDEATVCNPTTPYGVAKNALRQLVEGLCIGRDITFQWMRGFYLVDNSGKGSSIFAKIVSAARAGQKEFPFTSGENAYDFVLYDEFCDQVVGVVDQKEVDGIINICSGKAVPLGAYIEGFIVNNEFDIELAYGKFPDRPYDSPAIWGDSSKIDRIKGRGA